MKTAKIPHPQDISFDFEYLEDTELREMLLFKNEPEGVSMLVETEYQEITESYGEYETTGLVIKAQKFTLLWDEKSMRIDPKVAKIIYHGI